MMDRNRLRLLVNAAAATAAGKAIYCPGREVLAAKMEDEGLLEHDHTTDEGRRYLAITAEGLVLLEAELASLDWGGR